MGVYISGERTLSSDEMSLRAARAETGFGTLGIGLRFTN